MDPIGRVFVWAKESCSGWSSTGPSTSGGLMGQNIADVPKLIFKTYDKMYDSNESQNFTFKSCLSPPIKYPCHEFAIHLEPPNTNPQNS